MAVAAQVPGSFLIPDQSELFLGFTSTQKAGLGPPKIANLEELGFSERRLLQRRGRTSRSRTSPRISRPGT